MVLATRTNCSISRCKLPTRVVVGWLFLMGPWFSLTGCTALAWPKLNESNERGSLQKSQGAVSLSKLVAELRRPLVRTQASHFRAWRPDLMVLPYAEIGRERVKIYNIRDCEYRTEEDYDVRHYDREFALADIRTVDFIVVPFQNAPLLAHTMLSFGLAGGEYIVISVEARLEQGENYSLVAGAARDLELMYVVGSERDLIRLRTEVRKVDVYLYPARATPDQVQRLMLSMLGRVNEIARQPEFYEIVGNNCTTNIVEQVNQLRPGRIPNDIRVLLPGHSDRLAYDLGLLAAEGPFERIRAASRINFVARLYADAPDFSQRIRVRL